MSSVYIADMGVFDTTSVDVPLDGNLLRVEVGVEGMPLFMGAAKVA